GPTTRIDSTAMRARSTRGRCRMRSRSSVIARSRLAAWYPLRSLPFVFLPGPLWNCAHRSATTFTAMLSSLPRSRVGRRQAGVNALVRRSRNLSLKERCQGASGGRKYLAGQGLHALREPFRIHLTNTGGLFVTELHIISRERKKRGQFCTLAHEEKLGLARWRLSRSTYGGGKYYW